jgi:hypothetical protein
VSGARQRRAIGVLIAAVCVLAPARAVNTASRLDPRVVAVSPGAGGGAGSIFRFFYADAGGAAEIAATEAVIVGAGGLTGVNACFFHAAENRFWLRNDANTAWLGPVIAGSSGRIANAQCTLAAAGSSIVSSGTSVVVTVALTFAPAFAGAKDTYMEATDRGGFSSGWLRAGTWTVRAMNPQPEVVTSTCADAARDPDFSLRLSSEQAGRVSNLVYTPACFPAYNWYYPHEGHFAGGRPLPVMGRVSGHFDILIAFTDSEVNRRELLDNTYIAAGVKEMFQAGRFREGLQELFTTYYTPAAVMDGVGRRAAAAVSFTFTVGVTRLARRELEFVDDGLGFARYDAVVLLDDLVTASGYGVRRWPSDRRGLYSPHVFNTRDTGVILNIDPGALFPGLFGNELLRRNMPNLLVEYQIGEQTLVREGTVLYDRTPIVNPRTGENIEPLIRSNEGKTSVSEYLKGYADVDGDGVVDCLDPEITPTADNVDGDFIPDRFDPDLRFDHRPYLWMFAARP